MNKDKEIAAALALMGALLTMQLQDEDFENEMQDTRAKIQDSDTAQTK